MNQFSFQGRPDGIGNRIEEIIYLEAICSKLDVTCEYVWRNLHAHRSYEVCFEAERVQVVTVPDSSLPVKGFADFNYTFTQEEILRCARLIRPRFDQSFPSGVRPVGVHIRGTDRIGLANHPHYMKDVDELKMYFVATLRALNELKPKQVFVCADSDNSKNVFLEHLNPAIDVIEARSAGGVSPEYVDFFALSNCSKIWMVSRFSSFSITASLIGNCPLVSFVNDPTTRQRYKALFEYVSLSSEGEL